MAWSKLDEDRAAADELWSAFLLKGLTDNVNAYASELARALPPCGATSIHPNGPPWQTSRAGW